jgi:2-methylcitrate dehydratase PrpD
MAMTATYTEQLADFVTGCKLNDIPADVREKTALLLLDALGVAIYNSDKPFVRMLADIVERTVKEGPCTAVGNRHTYVAEGAALLNSAAIHGNDFDATHIPAIMHTSAVVVPTALAIAEEVGSSGSELVTAIITGFEVLIRMGLATQGAMHRVGFQSTALCAPIALTLVAGRLYQMPRAQVVSAAGLAASIAAGLRAFSDDGTWGKRIITGWACRAALMAIALAREGYPGTRDVLEKQPFGFYKAFVQGGGYELRELTKGLGQEWTTRDIDVKLYPCSHGHHAFIDTARRARSELKLLPENIQSVQLHVSSEARKWWFEPRERKYELPDVYGSRFSMPYTIALALVFGDLKDEYLDSREFLDDPRVKAVVARVSPKIDDSLSNTNPNRLPGTMEIVTTDGRTSRFDGAGHVASGHAFKNAVLEKFSLNVSKLKPGQADKIIARAIAIEKQPDVGPLMGLLRF